MRTVGIAVWIWLGATVAQAGLTEAERALVARKNGMTAAQLQAYEPHVHPRVEGPVAEGVALAVPPGLGNARLAAMGIVDATAAPFSADPTGGTDSTAAIRRAVDFARDHQMVLFFPAGTYRISDTIECRQKLTVRGNGRLVGAPLFPCALVGSARPGKRSVFHLAPNSRGFGDPTRRKIVVHIVNCNYGGDKRDFDRGPLVPQANISFNQIFADIDIVIGEGNGGAVGIRMQAAEGSSIQNVAIDATHGHTGMLGAAGSGGSHHNLTVRGGRIGIDTRGYPPEFREDGTGTQPTPTMAHVTLLGQTEAALVNRSRGPLIAVGWEIDFPGPGPAIRTERDWPGAPGNGGLALVDSVVRLAGQGGGALIAAEKSFYLRNVHLHGAETVAEGVPGHRQGWLHVEELAYPIQPRPFKGFDLSESVYLDGKRQTTPYARLTRDVPPPDGFRRRHIWNDSFPSWQTPGVANVKDARYGAVGDSMADDTAALQRAIDENEVVFLPKGYYRVTDTLRLRPRTKLIGVAHHLSTILARPPYGALAAGSPPRPLVETADTAEADTVLAFVGILLAAEADTATIAAHGGKLPFYALHWRCGGTSVVRSPQIARGRLHGFPNRPIPGQGSFAYGHPAVRISGHGGGRWYNFFIHGLATESDEYRHILVDGARGPLSFYHLHAQHADSFAQCEIRDSRDVSIYGVKSEYQTRFLTASGTSSLRLFGHGGNATSVPGSAHYLFADCPDLLVTSLGDQIDFRQTAPRTIPYHRHPVVPFTEYAPFIVTERGRTIRIPHTERPILWRSGL